MSNEAAKRLYDYFSGDDGRRAPINGSYASGALDAALAGERRATVERIRVALGIGAIPPTGSMLYHAQAVDSINRISEVLDAEAAR